jgi:hypothetical protein
MAKFGIGNKVLYRINGQDKHAHILDVLPVEPKDLYNFYTYNIEVDDTKEITGPIPESELYALE